MYSSFSTKIISQKTVFKLVDKNVGLFFLEKGFLPPQYFAKKPTFALDLRRSLFIMQTFDLISRIPIGD